MKQESLTKLQNILDNLINKYGEFLGAGKYNEALNVMKNIEMIIRQLSILGVKVIDLDKKEDGYLDWYVILKFFIESKQPQLINLNYNKFESNHRGTGKTTSLLRLAHDYNLPIITKSYLAKDLNRQASSLGLKVEIASSLEDIDFSKFKDNEIILVDEGVDTNLFRGCNKILIGFKRQLIS